MVSTARRASKRGLWSITALIFLDFSSIRRLGVSSWVMTTVLSIRPRRCRALTIGKAPADR
ncbi:hypothetical protein D3C80_2109950 [compost metagenome]